MSALSAVAKTNKGLSFFNPHTNARRVLLWYNLFARAPPIVVMGVDELEEGGSNSHAEITPAVRELASYAVCVASSIPPTAHSSQELSRRDGSAYWSLV